MKKVFVTCYAECVMMKLPEDGIEGARPDFQVLGSVTTGKDGR